MEVLVIWLICGVFAYAVSFAYWQRRFPTLAERDYEIDMGFSMLFGLGGPFGLLVAFMMSGFAKYGLKWR